MRVVGGQREQQLLGATLNRQQPSCRTRPATAMLPSLILVLATCSISLAAANLTNYNERFARFAFNFAAGVYAQHPEGCVNE